MSTTTVTFTSTTQDAGIAALRQRESQARGTARRTARRAEAERLRTEVEKRRMAAADRRVAELDIQFQDLIARLDAAARRLPDLTLSAPELSSLSAMSNFDAAKLEQLAETIAVEVGTFSTQLDSAIAQAERLLARRLASVAAWRDAQDLEQQIEFRTQNCRQVASQIGTTLQLPLPPAKPSAHVELEVVQAYVSALQAHRIEVEHRHASLSARSVARVNAIALGGDSVQTRSAESSLMLHKDERRRNAEVELRVHLEREMSQRCLSFANLSGSLRALVDDALKTAALLDHRERITLWIARASQQAEDARQALALLQAAPDLVHDDEQLSERWTSLSAQLQWVASGLEAFSPSIEREYQQLCTDAQRLLNTAFTKADWIQAMCAQGFEVLERADGAGMIVVDLDHPDVWLEVTELEAAQGGYAVSLDLKSDAKDHSNDSLTTKDVCSKLSKAAKAGNESVTTTAEEVERKSRITRGRRPVTAQKSFAQPL